jgi:hypothetical protein
MSYFLNTVMRDESEILGSDSVLVVSEIERRDRDSPHYPTKPTTPEGHEGCGCDNLF